MKSMMKRVTGAGTLLCLTTLAMAAKPATVAGPAIASRPSTPFVKNNGQWKDAFEYKAECGNIALFVERNALTWRMWQSDFAEVVHDSFHHPGTIPVLHGHSWRTRFIGADPVKVEASGAAKHYFNFFIGNDPSRWRSRVPVYAEVKHTGLWPGVDLRLYRKDGHYEYDMIVASGTDASVIRMGYDGLNGLHLNKEGELVMSTSLGDMRESAPKAFYADGAKEQVACVFTLKGTEVGFAFPKGRNAKRPVIIDPFLVASTLTGTGDIGTTQNYGHTATYDAMGNIYTGAICFGQGYPTTLGAFDDTFGGGFGVDFGISKLNPDGSDLLYGTYVGSSGSDHPHSMVVTPTGELTIYGTSDGSDFPTTPNAYDPTANGLTDIVVTKLNADGTALVGSTYIGTNSEDGHNQLTGNYGDLYRGEVICDVNGDILVSSCTNMGAFPTTAGAYQTTPQGGQDGVVFRLNTDLSVLEWSTMLGTAGGDMAFGLKLDGSGGVYVGGATDSNTFPATPGAYQTASNGGQEGYVAHITADGTTLAQCTYFGGTGEDPAFFLQLDGSNNVYIYGQTDPSSIDISPPGTFGVANGFIYVAEFSPDLSTNIFRTTHGTGFGNCVPVAFLVDVCNNIYISGYSTSGNEFPSSQDALYTTGGFYLACYEPNMTGLRYATYYQGASHVDGGTSRFDDAGIVYQAVCTSGSFPTTPNAWSSTQPSGWDLGVFKIDFDQGVLHTSITADYITACAPAEFVLHGTGGAQTYTWDLGNGDPPLVQDSVVVSYDTPGVYDIILVGVDTASCNVVDTAYITLTVNAPSTVLADFTAEPNSSCSGYSVTVDNLTTDGNGFAWDFGNGQTSSDEEPGTIPYDAPGEYTIVLDALDPVCANGSTESIVVDIPPATMPYDLPTPVTMCEGVAVTLDAGGGYDSYDWNPGPNTQTNSADGIGWYVVTVTQGVCSGTDSIEVVLAYPHAPLGDRLVCPLDSGLIGPPYAIQQILWSTGDNSQYITVDDGTFWFTAMDEQGCIVHDTITVERIASTLGHDFVPNVFSPNGDGKNDLFTVKATGLGAFSMQVFNRWGMKMYETSDWTHGWNGKRDNVDDQVPDGTYFYIIDYQDRCVSEAMTSKHGHVTLLR